MEIVVSILIIYFTAGAAVALLLALGVAQMSIQIFILDHEIDVRYAQAALLVMALLFWPVVVWLILVGKKRKRIVAQAEVDAQADAARVQRFAGQQG